MKLPKPSEFLTYRATYQFTSGVEYERAKKYFALLGEGCKGNFLVLPPQLQCQQ